MKPATAGSKSFFIPSLDGLRAVSILIVFLSHAGLHKYVPGLFGVTVFFFLSGYLITTLLRLECEQTGGVSLGDFYWRRMLRIFPPFYIALGGIVVLAVTGVLSGVVDWTTIAAQAAHVANYQEILRGGAQLPGTEVLWSLAVEEHFYLVFPFLYLGLRRWVPSARNQFLILAGLAAAVLAWRVLLVLGLHAIPLDPNVSHHPRTCHATDTRLDSLLFGCMLAVYGNPALDPTRTARRAWIFVGLPLALLALAVSFAIRGPAFRETLRYTLQGVALFPMFIASIRYADAPIFRPLNWGWVRFLGVLSYPLYLTHSTVIALVQQGYPTAAGVSGSARTQHLLVQGVIALVASLVLAALVHYAVEKPVARLRKRLSHVKAPTAAGK